jgi:hypothetical protein
MTLCSSIVQTGHSGSQGKEERTPRLKLKGREREREEAERMQCGRWRSERCEEHGR